MRPLKRPLSAWTKVCSGPGFDPLGVAIAEHSGDGEVTCAFEGTKDELLLVEARAWSEPVGALGLEDDVAFQVVGACFAAGLVDLDQAAGVGGVAACRL